MKRKISMKYFIKCKKMVRTWRNWTINETCYSLRKWPKVDYRRTRSYRMAQKRRQGILYEINKAGIGYYCKLAVCCFTEDKNARYVVYVEYFNKPFLAWEYFKIVKDLCDILGICTKMRIFIALNNSSYIKGTNNISSWF